MDSILVIKKMLLAVDLSSEEKQMLVDELISEWKLNPDGFLMKSTSLEETPKKRCGRLKKVKTEEAQVSSEETPKKRRGRPKKVKTEEAQVSSEEAPKKRCGRPKKVKTEEAQVSSEEGLENTDIYLQEDLVGKDDIEILSEDETVKSTTLAKPVKMGNSVFKRFEDNPCLQKLVMGKELQFSIVYQWENHLLLSPYALIDLLPLGIYVPYKIRQFNYRGFIVDMYNEDVLTELKEALNYVREKREAVDNEEWGVMNSLQWGILRDKATEINAILRKIGGDPLGRSYKRASPGMESAVGVGKMRYVLDVK